MCFGSDIAGLFSAPPEIKALTSAGVLPKEADPKYFGDKVQDAVTPNMKTAVPAATESQALASTPRSTKRTGQILAASTPGAIGSQTPFTTSLTGLQTQLGAK